jgi:hypothetical protein
MKRIPQRDQQTAHSVYSTYSSPWTWGRNIYFGETDRPAKLADPGTCTQAQRGSGSLEKSKLAKHVYEGRNQLKMFNLKQQVKEM